MTLFVHEDNQAMIQVVSTARNPTMRHLGRTHHVDIDWLHESVELDGVVLFYEDSSRQAADILTKGFTNPIRWARATELVGVFHGAVAARIEKEGSFIAPPQVAPLPEGESGGPLAPRPGL